MSLNNADEYRDWSEIENKLRFHLQNESYKWVIQD